MPYLTPGERDKALNIARDITIAKATNQAGNCDSAAGKNAAEYLEAIYNKAIEIMTKKDA